MMQLTLKSQNIFCDKGITKGKTQIVVTYTHTHRHTQTYCCSVAQSCPPLCYHMDRVQHTRLPCLPLSPRVCSSSCPLSQWCHPTISVSVVPFSFCLQSFLASESFPMSRLFASVSQYTHTHTDTHTPTHIYLSIYMCILYICVCVYTQMYIHTNIHIHMDTHLTK